ncbi:MAG: peptidoglycan-associated lipoprotein Pal [Bacteriovoracaceae bacterium]|nr:peptidoglycan-associated lipoprotein Pal [Bacteriovoracaceae bacterium]
MTLRKIALPVVMALLLSLVGCSGAKKNVSADEVSLDAVNTDGISFELNASSDQGSANGLKTIYFPFNSATLTADTTAALESNAQLLKDNATVEVQVEGHCDERGGVQFNLALGEKRAKAVKNYLTSMGVESRRVTIISYGKERPLLQGHDDESWSQNRRGNFVVTAK